MSRVLGNNPFLKEEAEEKPADDKREEFTTASFKIRKSHLKKLRDLAYTRRLSQKNVLDNILRGYFETLDEDLLEAPEQPVIHRKKGNKLP